MTQAHACLFIILLMQLIPNMTKENKRLLNLIIHLVSTYETNLNKETVLNQVNYIYSLYNKGDNVNLIIEILHDDLICDKADEKTFKTFLFLNEYGQV